MILGTTPADRADRAMLVSTVEAAVDRIDPADGRSERVDRDGPFDRDLWALLSGEVGIGALAVPEDRGGLGASFADVAAVLAVLGAELSRVPYLSAVVATAALTDAPASAVADDHLGRIAAGRTIVTTVVPTADTDVDFRADGTGDTVVLTGTASFVVDALGADVVLVFASSPNGVTGLYAVAAEALSRAPMPTTDATRGLSTVTADRAPAVLVDPNASISRLRDRALVALACDSLGVARRTLDDAVGYAGSRVQFGRAVGGFQAVKHRLAEAAVALELAETAVAHAVWAVEAGSDHDLAEAAAIAAIVCGEAASRTTADNVQVHGGIGFTWEHTAHRYYRRALTNAVLWGSGDDHAQRLYELTADGQARVDPDTVPRPAVALSS
ncbi:acyl-CoA dehydrogenase family protein [Rhodococcus sp. NPDC003318]|uniref:acyl-CoA dehydrogenase family protein n=1 Tax=Rhodococcus sp. NPDC003318 TaxID=3364503 RepID=UPI0036ACABB2